ncbi:unnamed protein product [Tilletia caries]|nr:unnamed protein product [Tilletia caries]
MSELRQGPLPNTTAFGSKPPQGPQPLMLRQVKVRFRYEPITTWIQQLLPRPNVLAYCREHTQRQKTAGVYRDLYDGSNWSSRDGDDSFDLVLRLSLMIDWVQPFYRLGTASYSCCVVSLRVDDLPFRLRNSSSYTHVCCILPGPQKPTAEGLHAALDIMVAELCRLQEEGLHVPELLNHDTGHPIKVRIRLERLLADTDARTITAGFPSHSSKGQFCPWCTIDYDEWVGAMLEGEEAPSRDADRHRRKSLSALPEAVPRLRPSEIESLRREEAACLSALYKIPGWSSLHNAPVDVMHNLDLGLCKHFWVQTLVDGKLLDRAGLHVCKEVLQATTYPIGVTRISPDLGHTSGGTPTAAGWSVLSQYIMPVLIASAWTGLLLTSAHKTFHTAKVRMVKQGLADGVATEPTPASTSVASTSATVTRSTSTPTPVSTAASPNPERARKRKQKDKGKEKEKEPEFIKSVSLVVMLEAALVLASACRIAHSRVIDEPQLEVLQTSLKTFVTINATEIGPLSGHTDL